MPGSADAVRFPVYCLKPANDERVASIAHAFGGTTPDTRICDEGANEGPDLYCIANRAVDEDAIHDGVDRACRDLESASPSIDCHADCPSGCGDAYARADWVFSIYSAAMGITDSSDDTTCNFFGGDGEFSPGDLPPLSAPSSAISTALPPRPDCTADPSTAGPSPTPPPRPSPTPPAPAPRTSSPAPPGEEADASGARAEDDQPGSPTPPAPAPSTRRGPSPHLLGIFAAATSALCCVVIHRRRRQGAVRMAQLDGLRAASAATSSGRGVTNMEMSGGFAAMH